MSKLNEYRGAKQPLPSKYDAWQIFGAGFENVGKDGKPVTLQLREPHDNEILLRVDVLGLCLSDIKIINQGSAHARLRGRDLSKEPTVLGHECAATVVRIGKNWASKFKVGERFIVQADIYNGVVEQDEGNNATVAESSTAIPAQLTLQVPVTRLAEKMSYNLGERMAFLPGGSTLIVRGEGSGAWEKLDPGAKIVSADLAGLEDGQTFDDIVVTGPTPEIVAALASRLRKNGVMWLVGREKSKGPVSIDVGRIHYEGFRFYGGGSSPEEIRRANERGDLLPGGKAIFFGAGGPMGQMHVQRSIEIANGPSRVVVTDLDRGRLDHIENRFSALAKAKGVELITLAPSQFESQQAMDAKVRGLAPNGYDDLVILAPVAKLVPGVVALAADNAVVNVFAGLVIGSMADLRLEDLCRGIKLIGSSGSRISDLRKVLAMVEGGELNTNLSVAAIGGLNSAREGLEGVSKARFPGKTVIYTQIPDLPLMALEDIPAKLPELKDKLDPSGAWTKEAEEALLEKYA
ncbi:MAG: alcohol dehydrogenase catalytic domain-containing protein [Candidatus Hydrogenedentes bacterium]|nr:alcohol dehydrogenase catalytic domain-containing protein [Candidatus Hydrogenedentota bacterium]